MTKKKNDDYKTEKDKLALFNKIQVLRMKGVKWDDMEKFGITSSDRKGYYGFEALVENGTFDEVINAQQRKLDLEKKQFQIEKQVNAENVKYMMQYKVLHEQALQKPRVKLKFKKLGYKPLKSWYVVTLSDFHYHGDTETLKVFEEIGAKLVDFIKKKEVKELVLAELGDTIEGASLRTSQLQAIKAGMVEQAVATAEAYKQMLEYVIKKTGVNLYYVGVSSSNHTQLRNNGTKRNELPREDLMVFIHNVVKQAKGLKDAYIGSEIFLDLNDYLFYFAHGHMVGKKEEIIQKLDSYHTTNIDFAFFGHYHHSQEFDIHKRDTIERLYDTRVIFVPSCSIHESQYEKDKMLSSSPGFGIYEFNNRYGNIGSSKIKIDTSSVRVKKENIEVTDPERYANLVDDIEKLTNRTVYKAKKI